LAYTGAPPTWEWMGKVPDKGVNAC